MREYLAEWFDQLLQFLDEHQTEIVVGVIASFIFLLIWSIFKAPFHLAQSLWQRVRTRAKPKDFPPLTPKQARRNRKDMLTLVKGIYRNRLEQSLHGAAMLELGLEVLSEVVHRPWDTILKVQGQTDRLLPRDTDLLDVFDQAGHTLLILGEPGSGKTTMLLELANGLVERAGDDNEARIPVVFNLSTWTDEKQSLDEWLVAELRSRYNVGQRISRPWLEDRALCLLLDGLDEVAEERREVCVQAINAYRQTHDFPQLAICCRTKAYEAMNTRLDLQQAVAIQPLTAEDIDTYLAKGGVALKAVHATLQTDEQLQELVTTPLMLSIMTLAYKNKTRAELQPLTSVAARREHIFDHYIEAVLTRRGDETRYPHHRTRYWLAWLAHQLSQHHTTSFFLEDLQPDWLSKRQERSFGLFIRLVVLLAFGLSVGLVVWLVFGVVGGLVFGVVGGLIVGLIVGLGDIEPVEKLEWSWREARVGLIAGLIAGLFVGLFVWLVFGLSVWLVFGLSVWLSVGLGVGLSVGLIVWLGGGLSSGLRSSTQVDTRARPNQGIWQSVRSFLIIGLVFGLGVGLVVGLVFGLGVGLSGGPGVGLGVGLEYGGRAFTKHFLLRFFLRRLGVMPWPWRYVPFLDYAADCMLLQKIGPGYRFHHELLQRHFVAMYEPGHSPS